MTELIPPIGRAALTDAAPSEVIERATEAAREMLGMECAFLSDTRSGTQEWTVLTGDAASFGLYADNPPPLEGTYCERMLRGDLENIVHYAQNDPVVSHLDATEAAG